MSDGIDKPARDISDGAKCCESIRQVVDRFRGEHERVSRIIERQDADLARLREENARLTALVEEAGVVAENDARQECQRIHERDNPKSECFVCIKKGYKKMNMIWNSKPWMRSIHPSLLHRLWEKKGCPGILVLSSYGITMTFSRIACGILQMKQDRNFGVFYHASTRPVRSTRAAR